MVKKFLLLMFLTTLGLSCLFTMKAQADDSPVAGHPRLWIREQDLPRLRSWAIDSNPIYKEGLAAALTEAKTLMDNGTVPQKDGGTVGYEDYPTESYAALFAFMSLIDPNEAARKDEASRARTLLMVVMNKAVLGVAQGQPFRDPDFPINDRSRWFGANFALTVDWIYPSLSQQDLVTIHKVFSLWSGELEVASMTNNNHPEPQDVVNDPALLNDPIAIRWSNNNYYAAHMRNLGLMALSMNPSDDPDGALAKHFQRATGAWLYVMDHVLRTDVAGGLGAEGFEYSPQTLGYVAQFLLALHTAGITDTAKYRKQITFPANPFWDDAIKAYIHSTSPASTNNPDFGTVYQPAWYGSGQNYVLPDYMEFFGTLGAYDQLTQNTARLNTIRWLETNTAPGGPDRLLDRMQSQDSFHRKVLYFLLFDPTASAPSDPRPQQPLTYYAPGMRRLLARTSWKPDAAWFTYSLSWDNVDHQSANGNSFEFYRNGEWLTKVRAGYDLDYLMSDNQNTLVIENSKPEHDDYRLMIAEKGSQVLYLAGQPPAPVYSIGKDYVYAQGDATNLYNSVPENSVDVYHASRSVLWLQPDVIVVYDRAVSKSPNHFKRFLLNFPANAVINGKQITMMTAAGQKLYVTSVLPAQTGIQVAALKDEPSGAPANYEPMKYRLTIDATGNPISTQFLNVLQGADKTAPALKVTEIKNIIPIDGVLVGDTAVFFLRDYNAVVGKLTINVPSTATRIFITGMQPGDKYDLSVQPNSDTITMTLSAGTTGTTTADSGGVILWTK